MINIEIKNNNTFLFLQHDFRMKPKIKTVYNKEKNTLFLLYVVRIKKTTCRF